VFWGYSYLVVFLTLMEVVMIITVRCFYVPADLTFNTDDVVGEIFGEKDVTIYFEGSRIVLDKQHYLDEKNKK